ncbi:ROK family transcriptional regulator [Amycolatopsis sp. FDAARGOS 1241]|uniref:ROK family transcriptional regulator n=1 Tax=Amycolatopsis sp. FDAARGOS 1241 TaxID=2778070 RepID=UPI001EF2CDA9|nr:ROK family transcriptional regulator [Amycolatopsis sp. FDAARGOS 1241]
MDPLRRVGPADQAGVRRSNLALVLRHLRDAGPRSRAGIAAETGLNKATVSSLVAELVERGLAREGERERAGAVGRPGTIVELDGRGVGGVGVEINVDYLTALALDLTGTVLFEQRVALDVQALTPAKVLDATAELAARALRECRRLMVAPVGLTLAIPALVDVTAGTVAFAPNLHWTNEPVVEGLTERLTQRLGRLAFPVRMANDANLGALGEYAMGSVAGTADLVYLTGEIGVGGGVISGGRLLGGAEGFSGEIGHIQLDPNGRRCGCGRRGCWETIVGLAGMLRLAAAPSDPVHDPSLDLEQRLDMLRRRAELKDRRTLDALAEVGTGLGVGAAVLVNVFNPRVVLLGGYFAQLGPYLLGPMMAELKARVVAPDIGGCRVELSWLGFSAASRGGAHVALEAVFDDPALVAAGAGERDSG